MKHAARTWLIPAILAVAVALPRCTSNPARTAEGGGGTETVIGRLVDTEGKGVSEAAVRLYEDRSVPAPGNRGLIDSTSSDPDGAFMFEDVARGSYQIDAESRARSLRAIIRDVNVADAPVSLAAQTVSSAGSLTGWVEPQAPLEVSVGVAQSPYSAEIDAEGHFAFQNLPPRSHTLVVIVNRPGHPDVRLALDSQTVRVLSGRAAVADSMRYDTPDSGRLPLVFDDFDDCDGYNALGGLWRTYDDSDLGGTTIVTPIEGDEMTISPGRGGDGCALGVSYTLGETVSRWYPRAGMGCHFGTIFGLPRAVDFSKVRRVTFYAGGTAPNLYFSVLSTLDWDTHAEGRCEGLIDSGWTHYSVDLDSDVIGSLITDSTASWPTMRRFVSRITARTLDKEGAGGSGKILIDDIEIHFQ